MGDKELLSELGLEHSVLTKNKGKIPPENFSKILDAVKNSNNSTETRVEVAGAFSMWLKSAPGNGAQIITFLNEIFDTISELVLLPDDDVEDGSYKGIQCAAHSLVDGVSTASMFDQTQKFAGLACPLAYAVLEKMIKTTFTIEVEGAYVSKCAATERKETVTTLFRCCPYSGSVTVPCALTVISHFLTGDFPEPVKQAAKSAMQSMSNVNKECLQNSGMEIMEIIAAGGHDELIFNFLTMPELYTRTPESVHTHLEMVLTKFNWMQVCSLVNNVASRSPRELVPYTNIVMEKLKECPQMGAITIGIMKEIAKVDPDGVYPVLDDVIEASKNIQGSSFGVAGCIGAVAKCKSRPNCGDEMLEKMIACLKNCETAYQASVLAELGSLKENLSEPKVLAPHMEYISSFKDTAAVTVQALEDYFAG